MTANGSTCAEGGRRVPRSGGVRVVFFPHTCDTSTCLIASTPRASAIVLPGKRSYFFSLKAKQLPAASPSAARAPGGRARGNGLSASVSPAASGGFLTTWPNCMCQHPQWPPCDAKPWSLSPFYPKLFTRCSNPWKHYQGDAEAGVQPPFCSLHLRIEIHLNAMALIPKYSSPPLRKAAFSMAQCQHQPPMNSINI